METKQAPQPNQLNLNLSPEVADGTYVNMAVISHSTCEFVIDFACVMPVNPQANVKSRIILAPEHTKRLLLALQDNIARFESQFGKINLPQPQNLPPMPMGFGGGVA